MAAGYVEHAGIPGGRSPGREGPKRLIAQYHGALLDLRSTIEDVFAGGDRVAYRRTARGTHLGEWAGVSLTGSHTTVTGITVSRLVADKIVGGWVSVDLRPSEEELRWLTESGQLPKTSPGDHESPLTVTGVGYTTV